MNKMFNALSKIIILSVLVVGTCLGQAQKVENHTPYVTALLNRMIEQPHDTIKVQINKLIKGLVDSLIWDKLDCFYIMAASDTNKAQLNWIKNQHNLEPIGNITFEPFRGFMGDGALSFIETHYSPLADGINYTLNSCGAGIYSRTDTYALGDAADMGCGEKPPYIWINFKGTANGLMRPYLNSTTSSGSMFNYTGSTMGIISVNRISKDSVNIYTIASTGSTERMSTSHSSAIPDKTIWIAARNNGKAGTAYQNRQYAAAFIGGPLTKSDFENLSKFIEAYMDAVGAGVLP
jgi:hypothetical protein